MKFTQIPKSTARFAMPRVRDTEVRGAAAATAERRVMKGDCFEMILFLAAEIGVHKEQSGIHVHAIPSQFG